MERIEDGNLEEELKLYARYEEMVERIIENILNSFDIYNKGIIEYYDLKQQSYITFKKTIKTYSENNSKKSFCQYFYENLYHEIGNYCANILGFDFYSDLIKYQKYQKEKERLSQLLMHEPSVQDIVDYSSAKQKDIRCFEQIENMKLVDYTKCYDEVLEENPVMDYIVDDYCLSKLRDYIIKANFSERNMKILVEHFFKGLSKAEIARKYNISPERARQICVAIFRKLQAQEIRENRKFLNRQQKKKRKKC